MQDSVTYQYLKIVHHDETNHKRTIYLLGIAQNQINKWLLSLETQKLTDQKQLDQAIIQIKKDECESKNIEYVGETDDETSDSDAEIE